MTRNILISAILLLCLFSMPAQLRAQDSPFKAVEIDGLRIFTEEKVIAECALDRIPLNESAFKEAARRVNNYYFTKGYYLAITYRIEETPDKLVIFVDEGRLGQVIFKGVDDITLVRLKYTFTLKEKVYNRMALDREISRMKKQYGFKEIKAALVEASDYSQQFLQLDGSFQIPLLGEHRIPFFQQYGYRYNLVIEPSLYSKGEAEQTLRGMKYGLRFYYPGIIPNLRYKYPSLIKAGDKLQVESSAGISASVSNPFSKPTLAFIQGSSDYDFVPMLDSFFTPRMSASAYYSASQRTDVGLLSYQYVQTSGTMAPGITILHNLRIFFGAGMEKILFFGEKFDPSEKSEVTDGRNKHVWYTLSLKVELERYFGFLHPSLARGAQAGYTYYKDDVSFHKIDFSLHHDFSAYKLDIFSLNIKAVKLFKTAPFYYEHPVSDDDFFGFTGANYYTSGAVKIRLMYMSSIYRDFIFAGPYLHGVEFIPLHNSLSGRQCGVAYGISGRYLFIDQFEAKVFAGRDYLVSTGKSGVNISFSIDKKF